MCWPGPKNPAKPSEIDFRPYSDLKFGATPIQTEKKSPDEMFIAVEKNQHFLFFHKIIFPPF